ncbi:MAG TPA: ubiquitin-conjugating enzyme E2 [Acidimicrobiales bacterium]|nr:ubiquitin-conjugating enzyme E2 [Acidimicrobiales bacterium]
MTSTPRLRRLEADAAALASAFTNHAHVTIVPVGDAPYEAYRFVYRLRGVRLDSRGQPAWSDHHSVLLRLGPGYPRERPFAIMETPIFHPNISVRIGEEVTFTDQWSAAQSIVDIVVAIGELIQYQRYSGLSPLNPVAARWAAENASAFPVGHVRLLEAPT